MLLHMLCMLLMMMVMHVPNCREGGLIQVPWVVSSNPAIPDARYTVLIRVVCLESAGLDLTVLVLCRPD